MIKPPALQPGARVAVISPAGAPKPHLVERGRKRLAALGYKPVLFPSALAHGPLYYAGDVQARLADFHAAFADPSIGAVLCTRGGWGTAELLPHLDADLIRRNPKPFLGFSDPTTLHLWLTQTCGLISFYAPMLSPDFARGDTLEQGVHLQSLRSALTQTEPWWLGPAEGLRLLRPGKRTQTVQGTLFGGCLALLNDSLGTPWSVHAPESGSILFLEEIGTHPYQWDRMLLHLRYAGLLHRVQGIVFGDMSQCLASDDSEHRARENDLLEAALLYNLRDFDGPIAIGLQSGHVNTPNVTLPLGIQAELDLSAEPTLRLLEAAIYV